MCHSFKNQNTKRMEEKIQTIADNIAKLDTRVIDTMISDIAKATKKKRLSSGSLTFSQYCKTIAEFVASKKTAQSVIAKYNLA
jgi:hypothetical protein